MKNKYKIIPVFIPNLGCPNDCSFCNQKRITGVMKAPDASDVVNIIEQFQRTYKPDEMFEVAFYGGSFTAIDKKKQIMYLDAVSGCELKHCTGVRISTRPDCIDDNILKMLKYYNVRTIELGVQSLDDEVLSLNKRGHSSSHVYKACRLINQHGFILGIQTMTGLIGDTDDKSIRTALEVAELKPDFVRIYPTLVIRDTYLADLYYTGEYKPQTLESARRLSAKLMQIYKDNNIKVIRAGLCPTEDINEHADVVAGPFHPAFRQLAESYRIYCLLEKRIEALMTGDINKIEIYAGSRNVSDVIGYKKENIDLLRNKFKIDKISISCDNSLLDEFKIMCF